MKNCTESGTVENLYADKQFRGSRYGMVRAKFYVRAIELYNDPPESGTVKLVPVYGNSEENKSWSKATPSGELSMFISNPAAFAVFKDAFDKKKAFYIDFTPEE